MHYDKVIGRLVNKKWPSAEQKEWWYTKQTAARRRRMLQLYDKQDGKCVYCLQDTARFPGENGAHRRNSATLEHIVIQARGGTDHPSNLAMSCHSCNNARGNMDHQEFMTLRQDNDRWRVFLRNKIKRKGYRKRSSEALAKKAVRQQRRINELALLFLIEPKWLDVANELVRPIRERNDRRNDRRAIDISALEDRD